MVESGRVDGIPVRNLWLLMLYASQLKDFEQERAVAVEDNPDDIPNLVAEILCRRVERRIRRNLHYGYRSRKAVLGRLRGRIDLLFTERHRLLDKARIACRFDELTIDTPRNRFVRAALASISKTLRKKPLISRCKLLARSLSQMGVADQRPERREESIDRFGRHDADDRQMVAAAHLAFNLALPTEADGSRRLSSPHRDSVWMRQLYEKAIGGFYDVVLSRKGWRINAGRRIHWPVESRSSGVGHVLPSMQTDITLDHPASGRRIVIDTKFNKMLTRSRWKEETLRSGYLYQMYAYLRSQEDNANDPSAANAEGLLLHPSVGKTVDEFVVIQNHRIGFATVDLGVSSSDIRTRLLQVIEASTAA